MNKGFTLIELSAVLVILALVTGGIIGGKALATQAELRSVASEIGNLKSAIKIFAIEYNQLPGDFDQAEVGGSGFWPGVSGDGDNNGVIEFPGETLNIWQHLVLAEILLGDYEGWLGDPWPIFKAGINTPTSKIDGAIYSYNQADWDAFSGINGLQGEKIILGKILPGAAVLPTDPVLSVLDAASLDTKLDNGLAESGDIHVFGGYNMGPVNRLCTQGALDNDGPFNFDNPGKVCTIVFWIDQI